MNQSEPMTFALQLLSDKAFEFTSLQFTMKIDRNAYLVFQKLVVALFMFKKKKGKVCSPHCESKLSKLCAL